MGQDTYTADDELDLVREWAAAAAAAQSREGLRRYFEQERPHLLRAYDADFLFNAVETTRERLQSKR